MAYLNEKELKELGLKKIGENVCISNKASIYGAKLISIGDNVRIDDFCILSASESEFFIGNNVHIAAYTSMIGKGGIILSDFTNISSRVSIYSSSDDYSGEYMTSPVIPECYTNVDTKKVFTGKHVIIGCGTVILPGSFLEEGVAIGALSLVKGNCEGFNIYAGNPLKKVKSRSSMLLNLEFSYLKYKGKVND
ncbi:MULTISPECIES: hypothetical protein [Pantoea]|uniref:acyltransferase n=1 Tax=Pantoea TaxID=53335 RepID=UPI0008FD3097|nr:MULTISPECIES: hypothetical protein [unclassified Pantoea]